MAEAETTGGPPNASPLSCRSRAPGTAAIRCVARNQRVRIEPVVQVPDSAARPLHEHESLRRLPTRVDGRLRSLERWRARREERRENERAERQIESSHRGP